MHVASWQDAYRGILPAHYLASLSVDERESMWRRMIEQQQGRLLVVCIADEIIGFVAFGAARDEDAPADRAEIWAIYVSAEHWSAGAGRLLWLEALDRIAADGYTSVSLWVIAGNQRAIRFYERVGFVAEPQSRKTFELGGVAVDELRFVRGSIMAGGS